MSPNSYVIYILSAAFPLCFYKGLHTLASSLSLFTYVFVSVPILHAAFVLDSVVFDKESCIIILVICTILFFISDEIFLFEDFFNRGVKLLSLKHIEILTIILIFIAVVFSGSKLQWVNFLTDKEGLYTIREENSSGRAMIMGYLICWLKFAFLPILLITHLKGGYYIRICLTFLGFVLMFLLDMQKITLLVPIFMIILHLYMGDCKNKLTYKFQNILILGTIGVGYGLFFLRQESSIMYALASVFIMRTLCIEGTLSCIYFHFFESNPFTYYSHINIINALTDAYPYKEVLGYAVSGGSMNANACFMLTDGYAACGIWGFVIAGIFFILFKSVYNGMSRQYNKVSCFLISIPAISAMLNVSLFTAILSCGFLVIYFILRHSDIPELYNEKLPITENIN